MPIPVVIAAGAVMGAKGLGMGGAAYVGYQGASYVYNGVRDWIDPSRVTKRTNEALASLSKERQEKESERMHNLDEVVTGIKERKQQLENQSTMQQTRLQEVVLGVDTDRTEMQKQALQLTQVHEELEQSAQTQEELIAHLKHELQEKMAALDDARQQLASTTVRFEDTAKELAETKSRVISSESLQEKTREEITILEEQMRLLSSKNSSAIKSLETKLLHQKKQFESELEKSKLTIDELASKNAAYKGVIKSLTEKLEEAQANKQAGQSSPSFFRR